MEWGERPLSGTMRHGPCARLRAYAVSTSAEVQAGDPLRAPQGHQAHQLQPSRPSARPSSTPSSTLWRTLQVLKPLFFASDDPYLSIIDTQVGAPPVLSSAGLPSDSPQSVWRVCVCVFACTCVCLRLCFVYVLCMCTACTAHHLSASAACTNCAHQRS